MNSAQSNFLQSLNFLRAWLPEGPWAVTAIRPDKKGIVTSTFYPSMEHQLLHWLEEYDGNRNIYFHVNPTIKEATKKAGREDIKSVVGLHVDIDPRAGEDIAGEQARCKALLTERLPSGIPKPTALIFSGGGYQAFWKLSEPIQIDGDIEKAEDAKRFNQQLEIVFGGDNCHNIDRIMRLPGTMNIPDEKKKKKGRATVRAELIYYDTEAVYDLSKFVAAPKTQIAGARGFEAPKSQQTVYISGNVERITDVHALDEWGVTDRVKVIIAQGHHPDQPKAGASRSEWLFDAVCQLVRQLVPDDVIYAIITDPDWRISESVLDKGTGAHRYAIKQIASAKEQTIDPWLRTLNDRHAVIGNLGGRCRVIEEVWDPSLSRWRVSRQTFEDFRNRYMNQRIQIGLGAQNQPVIMEVGKWWLQHEQRRQFDGIIFAPERDVPGYYNLWQGFAFNATPGDKHVSFLDHIRTNVCSNDSSSYEYLIRWLANVVQHPDRPGQVAVVLRGGKGVGKSFFAKHFGKLFGRHFLQISNPSHLVGNFNSHLRDTVVLFADEAFSPSDKKQSSILKTLITEDTIQIEAKGVDVETASNFVHLIMASNDQHVVPASMDERRFFVLDVIDAKRGQHAYFEQIQTDLEAGGYENLLNFLLQFDLTDFRPSDAPRTSALTEQKLETATSWLDVLLEMSSTGVTPDHDGWTQSVGVGWVSVTGILEKAGFRPNDRSAITSLNKFLKANQLIVTTSSQKVEKRCLFEVNRPLRPIRADQTFPFGEIRRGQRTFYKLVELSAFRTSLSELQADWDESVICWRLRGDE